jgi:hypothetical protein
MIQLCFIPHKVGTLSSRRNSHSSAGTRFSADNLVKVRAQPVIALAYRVTGSAGVVKCQLPQLTSSSWPGTEEDADSMKYAVHKFSDAAE